MRAAVLTVILLALAFTVPGSAVAGTPRIPIFNVGTNEHLLAEQGDLYFDIYALDAAPSAERITISIPHAFNAILTDTPGTDLGRAYIGSVTAPGGTQTAYNGRLVVQDANAYSNDPSGQACDSNVHTAVWTMHVTSKSGATLDVPVAVDWTGTSYEATMCFDSLRAQGLELSEVGFHMSAVFRNPAVGGNYLFDGVVTPFAADGTPNAAMAYEVQGFEDLPQILTAKATYDVATKTLTVSGLSLLNGKPRVGVNVHIWVGKDPNGATMNEVGATVTGAGGKYSFKKKLPVAPKFTIGVVDHYFHLICSSTAQPGGCVSWTVDGRDTYITAVSNTRHKRP